MRWERMPLGLAFVPFHLSMCVSCCVTLFVDLKPYGLDPPVFSLILLSILVLCVQFVDVDPSGRGNERSMGALVGLQLGYWPTAVVGLIWPFIIAAIWLIQCSRIWRYSYPGFRIGLWTGFGASTGLIVGQIGAAVLDIGFLITAALFGILFPLLHWSLGRLPLDEEE
ncbi:MAG TPA: hypothetical protein HA330_05165 [Candidatus Thalassarchaeaceae archaeon]|nr:MAG TPA: hypothetical protein D7H85_05160 [Candidatus Poseidoniales archaeon]HII49258.1 hypothetical protein [Candidatus Thalassarchaeaceae archaeon]|tara:strand:- start:1287 stop:1790 length:504 start_codon:yes stop_codon:yes gene_type:complete